MGWFGTRTYVGASWTVMAEVNGSRTWTELTATNPFPNTIALGVSFRDTTGADAGFFTIRSLPGFAQTKFLALRNLPVPNLTTGWFLLFSFPTPIVPMALVYWSDAEKNHTEVSNVPIEQLDGDGFPDRRCGCAAASYRDADSAARLAPPARDNFVRRRKRRARARDGRVLPGDPVGAGIARRG
jgi:hypothetical protein